MFLVDTFAEIHSEIKQKQKKQAPYNFLIGIFRFRIFGLLSVHCEDLSELPVAKAAALYMIYLQMCHSVNT